MRDPRESLNAVSINAPDAHASLKAALDRLERYERVLKRVASLLGPRDIRHTDGRVSAADLFAAREVMRIALSDGES